MNEVVGYILGAAGAALSITVAIIGYLVKEGFRRNDSSNQRVEAKVDTLTTITTQTALSQGQQLSDLSIRVGALERDVTGIKTWKDDTAGFFSGLGFRKRDGDGG